LWSYRRIISWFSQGEVYVRRTKLERGFGRFLVRMRCERWMFLGLVRHVEKER